MKQNGVSRIVLDALQKRIAFDTDEGTVALRPRTLQPLEGFICFPSKGIYLGHLKSRRGPVIVNQLGQCRLRFVFLSERVIGQR